MLYLHLGGCVELRHLFTWAGLASSVLGWARWAVTNIIRVFRIVKTLAAEAAPALLAAMPMAGWLGRVTPFVRINRLRLIMAIADHVADTAESAVASLSIGDTLP